MIKKTDLLNHIKQTYHKYQINTSHIQNDLQYIDKSPEIRLNYNYTFRLIYFGRYNILSGKDVFKILRPQKPIFNSCPM